MRDLSERGAQARTYGTREEEIAGRGEADVAGGQEAAARARLERIAFFTRKQACARGQRFRLGWTPARLTRPPARPPRRLSPPPPSSLVSLLPARPIELMPCRRDVRGSASNEAMYRAFQKASYY